METTYLIVKINQHPKVHHDFCVSQLFLRFESRFHIPEIQGNPSYPPQSYPPVIRVNKALLRETNG